jgi:hypothetical protein
MGEKKVLGAYLKHHIKGRVSTYKAIYPGAFNILTLIDYRAHVVNVVPAF